MTAVEKLRYIAGCANDAGTSYLIEMWIQEHVLELGNAVHIDNVLTESQTEDLKYFHDRAIKELAANVVEKFSIVCKTPSPSIIPGKQSSKFMVNSKSDANRGTTFTRRIFIIKETDRG